MAGFLRLFVPGYVIETFRRTRAVLWALLLSLLCMVVVSSMKGYAGYLTKLIEETVEKQDWDTLMKFVYPACGAILLWQIFDILKDYLAGYVRYSVEVRMRNESYEHLMAVPVSFFDFKRTGDIISRMTNDLRVAIVVVRSTIDFINGLIHIVVLVAVATTQGGVFGLVVLVAVASFVLTLRRTTRKLGKQTRSRQRKLADVVQQAHETLIGVLTVKAFQAEEREVDSFIEENRRFLNKAMKVLKTKCFSKGVATLVITTAFIAVALGAGYMIKLRYLNAGTATMVVVIMVLLRSPSRLLAESYNRLRESGAAAQRFFELMAQPIPSEEGKMERMPSLSDSIEIKSLTFGYDERPVLENINLRIPKGSRVALVGPSGAGKSTLLDLIAGFYEPWEGEILFDGEDSRKYTRRAILHKMAIVTQEPFLFNTTIEENIRYGKPDASFEAIVECARLAHIHNTIMRLPEGYKTLVGERGETLSGGERQRITIARALLKDPEILLLDEATASLDPESEELVSKALEKLMEGRTSVMIAHKVRTVKNADLIVVMDNGRIKQIGSHQELVRTEGLYRRLFREELR